MNDTQYMHECNHYLNSFFNILKLSKNLEIISCRKILNKCVIIEKNDTFYSSTSVNLNHHSRYGQFFYIYNLIRRLFRLFKSEYSADYSDYSNFLFFSINKKTADYTDYSEYSVLKNEYSADYSDYSNFYFFR